MNLYRLLWVPLLLLLPFTMLQAEEPAQQQITDLDQLLESVRQRQQQQQQLNREREQAFLKDKQRQRALLAQTRKRFEQQQRANQPLLAQTEAQAAQIAALELQLQEQVEGMGDITGAFQEFAGDFAAVMQESMVTAQYPERSERLLALSKLDKQPGIGDIEALWLLLQEDMTAAGKVARFEAPVIAVDGTASAMPVVRVGTFSALSEAGFLRYIPETGELLALSRQPGSRLQGVVRGYIDGGEGIAPAVVDPTRGSLLGMMSYTPSLAQRIEQGGSIGLIILGLGALGLALTLWRSVYLGLVHMRVRHQLRVLDNPVAGNPLGRVILAARDVAVDDDELLQHKLDEAILAEIPALERGSGLIKLLAATSPLLGLLGTVTGMILTFQAISLFGTGDPKLMAGGISQALITTVLGLVVAIPLLFGHSVVATLARAQVQRLDEQAAGIIARRLEQQDAEQRKL